MSLSFERTQSVAIIGGGPGGYEAALAAAQLGAEVTVVERAGIGGSAVITDVVPSKTLIATADAAVAIAGAGELGVQLFAKGAEGKPLKPEIAINLARRQQAAAVARAPAVRRHARVARRGGRPDHLRPRPARGRGRRDRLDGPRRHRLRPHRGRHLRRVDRLVAARAAHREARRRAHPHLDAAVRDDRRCPSTSSSSARASPAPSSPRRLHEPRREGHARLEPRPGAPGRGHGCRGRPRARVQARRDDGAVEVARREGRARRRRRARDARRRPHRRGQPLPHGGRARSRTPRASASRRPACR